MQVSDNEKRTGQKKIWDFGLYVVLSAAVVGSIFLGYAFGIPHEEFMRWLALIGTTLVVFGFAISENQALRGEKSFWIFISTVFIAHCCAFAFLAIARTNLTGFKVMVICITEISLINILKNVICRERP